MKKISVIIPVYNVERYLETCLDSVINQTYQNLEIIIINDGSTDSSLEICKKYEKLDKRIILIDQKNKGLSGARNFGIKKATGDYIHFLDSDDYINLNYYEKMIEALGNTNADIVLGGFYNELSPIQKSVRYKFSYCYTSVYDRLVGTSLFFYRFACQYLVKKSLLTDNNILFTEGRYFEDLLFTLQVAVCANKVTTAPNTEYFYRKNNNSISLAQNKIIREKRRVDYKYMTELSSKLLEKYNIQLPRDIVLYSFKYYFLFISVITKKVYLGKVVYCLFGIRLFTRR